MARSPVAESVNTTGMAVSSLVRNSTSTYYGCCQVEQKVHEEKRNFRHAQRLLRMTGKNHVLSCMPDVCQYSGRTWSLLSTKPTMARAAACLASAAASYMCNNVGVRLSRLTQGLYRLYLTCVA
jgi:hypothetical protein